MLRLILSLGVGGYCLSTLYNVYGLHAAALGFIHAIALGVFMLPRGKRFD